MAEPDQTDLQSAVEPKEPSLPSYIVSPADIRRLLREIEGIGDFLVQSKVRASGSSMQLPRTTKSLDEISKAQGFNLLEEADRRKLKEFLESAQQKAPVVHISFASDPSLPFLEKIVEWFRREVNPMTLLNIGLEPGIAAGCILRTSNHSFDLSLRQYFKKQQPLLLKHLSGAKNE